MMSIAMTDPSTHASLAEARSEPWLEALLAVAPASAAVANYCDHLEHCEEADRAAVLAAAGTLRREGFELASSASVDLIGAYAARLASVEARSPLYPIAGFSVEDEIATARSWVDLQRVQAQHDRLYHADVMGLHKQDQLRHCALHLSKFVGALAEAVVSEDARADFARRRLPDMLLFGLKLATLLGQRLEGDFVGGAG